MIRLLLIAAISVTATRAATVVMPSVSPPAAASTSVAPPDMSTSASPPPVVTGDSSASPASASTAGSVSTQWTVTDGESSTAVPAVTAPPNDTCKLTEELDAVKAFTDLQAFVELSENQQIFVYELLAAAESCSLKTFMSAETAQRFFLLAEDLPLKYVYTFVSFMARSLEGEGVDVPV